MNIPPNTAARCDHALLSPAGALRILRSLGFLIAALLLGPLPAARAQLAVPLFAGSQITTHNTTYSWSGDESSEAGATRTDRYFTADNAYSITVVGNSAGTGVATTQGTSGEGSFNGFAAAGTYHDAVETSPFSDSRTIGQNVWQGTTRTVTYSSDGTTLAASQTTEAYQSFSYSGGAFTATWNGDGNGGFSGNVTGFIRNGTWYADHTFDISSQSLTLNNHYYQGQTETITHSLDGSGNVVTTTTDAYAGVTVVRGSNGSGTISGSENGYIKNGTWGVNHSGTLSSPAFSPPGILFGNSYALSMASPGSYTVTYEADLNTIYSETATFTGAPAGSCSTSYTVSSATGAFLGSISGNDPSIGSFTGNTDNNTPLNVIATRTGPSFAPLLLWNYSTTISWRSGTADSQTGYGVDTYRSDDNSITVIISANLQDYVTTKAAAVVMNGVGAGTYDGNSERFTGYELQTVNGNRFTPLIGSSTSLWVNGSQYAFTSGFDGANGSSTDNYSNASLGTLSLSRSAPAGTVQVGLSFAGMNYSGACDWPAFWIAPVSGQPPVQVATSPSLVAGAPAMFWVNGFLYTRQSADSNQYSGGGNRLIAISGSPGDISVTGYDGANFFFGMFSGNAGLFTMSAGGWFGGIAYPANADGSAQLGLPEEGTTVPPAIFVPGRGIWRWLGTIGGDSYYGDAGPLSTEGAYPSAANKPLVLKIAGNGSVSLTDATGALATGTGAYSFGTHLFSSSADHPLPKRIYGVAPCHSDQAWGLASAPAGRPEAILVDGDTWILGGTDETGVSTYYGYVSGQQLVIDAAGREGLSHVALTDPYGTGASGSYYNGSFALDGTREVFAGRFDGSRVFTPGATSLYTMNSDLDITGNVLSLGTWIENAGIAGMTLQYSEQFTLPGAPLPSPAGTALIYLTGSRQNSSWLWNHAESDGANTNVPMMLLAGADHSLSLYDPADPAVPAIVLNPAGRSRFDKPIRIEPQGNLDMGEFRHGPGEPE